MKERYLLVLVRGIGQTVCCQSPERIFESRRWGRRSCKQLSDTVTERKNLLLNSDLRAERDCTVSSPRSITDLGYSSGTYRCSGLIMVTFICHWRQKTHKLQETEWTEDRQTYKNYSCNCEKTTWL